MLESRDTREHGRGYQLAPDWARALAATRETFCEGRPPRDRVVTRNRRPARNLRRSWPRRHLDATHTACGGARDQYEASSNHCLLRSWEGETPAPAVVPGPEPDRHPVFLSALSVLGWMEENGSAAIPKPLARSMMWMISIRCVVVGRRQTTSDGSGDGRPARSSSDAPRCACMAFYVRECGSSNLPFEKSDLILFPCV